MLAADSGGSGLRIALADASRPGEAPEAAGTVTSPEPVRTSAEGIDADHMLAQLVPAARELLTQAGAEGGGLDAVCVGAAGMATLGAGLRATLPGALARELGARHVALAADAVTGYAGALGESPGAVVTGGTGLIAVGTDLREWRRTDGWGHLLGDCGGGSWIGQAGLGAAMRDFDGREGGSPALRERAEERFGAPLSGLPAQLYPRTDRPAVLASFAPEVAACAAEGDPVAGSVMREAAEEIARAAAAVCPSAGGAAVALTGGLFRIGAPLMQPLEEELERRLPHARVLVPEGGPLDGALLVAARLTEGALRLPTDPALLSTS
ncbi:ATPase [Streptomyces sp. M600PL45_2]|uniref:ATPase n=1 Tax=Streptomyces marispadix TaxID=2922868 RepID=A0ABS9SS57_9ACTN|nr:BadF/BadG/BcrA/BcrD ATPase family protein [Streptomyces marispadix]MCH6159106.1 ATPase [Streptomyces marispadix]